MQKRTGEVGEMKKSVMYFLTVSILNLLYVLSFCQQDLDFLTSESSILTLAKKYNIVFDEKLPEEARIPYLRARIIIEEKPLSFDALHAQMHIGQRYKNYGFSKEAEKEYEKVLSFCDKITSDSKDNNLIDQSYWVKEAALINLKRYDMVINTAKYFYKNHPYSKQYLTVKRYEIQALIQNREFDKAIGECDYIILNYPKCRMNEEIYKIYQKYVKEGTWMPIEIDGKIIGFDMKIYIYEEKKDTLKQKECLKSIIKILEDNDYADKDKINEYKRKLDLLMSESK